MVSRIMLKLFSFLLPLYLQRYIGVKGNTLIPFIPVSPKLGWGKSQLQKFFAAPVGAEAVK